MKKIIIFGNSGSGKSTLAHKLANEHQLAHLDLDTLAWNTQEPEANDPPSRKPLAESQQVIDEFLQQNEAWVIEGCYSDLLSMIAPEANEAIFMDLSVTLCQENARNRPWEPHKYESKQAQDDNLHMLLEWIAAYAIRSDEFSYQVHLNLFQSFSGTKQQITQNQ